MQKFFLKTRLASFLLITLFASCGRKQRTLFVFPEKEIKKVHKLEMPAVKGLEASRTPQGVYLTWRPADFSEIKKSLAASTHLIGYHVFPAVKGRFVSKQPLTKEPINTTYFLDKHNKKSTQPSSCYLVRAIFDVDGQIVQGPASQIICI